MEDDADVGVSTSIRALPLPMSIKKTAFTSAQQTINLKEKYNWLIHILFLRQDYEECSRLIDELLHESKGRSEYALYAKALILRVKGNIHESLELFKKCHLLNPTYIDYLKQFGRSLYLLGRHKAAVEVFDEC
jgi:Bardet-Biedl syndrome 4 protein